MTYLLYMKRSFTRSSRRHAVLFAVLTCAFLLPLLISIYRDSKPTPAENDSRQENEKGARTDIIARTSALIAHESAREYCCPRRG